MQYFPDLKIIRKSKEYTVLRSNPGYGDSAVIRLVRNGFARFAATYPFLLELSTEELIIAVYSSTDDLIDALSQGDTDLSPQMIPGGYFSIYPVPHIALIYSSQDGIDAALAHELVHWSLSDFATPIWIEEGYAMGIEVAMGNRVHPLSDKDLMVEYFRNVAKVDHDYIFNDRCFLNPEHSSAMYSQAQLMTETLSRQVGSDLPVVISRSRVDGEFDSIVENEYGIDLEGLAMACHSRQEPGGLLARFFHSLFGV